MIERLLTPGSIPELAIRSCVLEKNTLRLFPLGSSSLPVLVALLTKDLQTEAETMLCVGVVRQTHECLVQTNERYLKWLPVIVLSNLCREKRFFLQLRLYNLSLCNLSAIYFLRHDFYRCRRHFGCISLPKWSFAQRSHSKWYNKYRRHHFNGHLLLWWEWLLFLLHYRLFTWLFSKDRFLVSCLLTFYRGHARNTVLSRKIRAD